MSLSFNSRKARGHRHCAEEVRAEERFEYIKIKAQNYDISFMAKVFEVKCQAHYKWLNNQEKPYKHAALLAEINEIIEIDIENKEYGIARMFEA